jgi:predicted dehydrogenase
MTATSAHAAPQDIGRSADDAAPLRVAIVGCGRVGETLHLPALRSLGPRIVEVTAVADMDEHRRRRVSAMFDVPRAYLDLSSMLHEAGDAIDVVVVGTPAERHADGLSQALEAGKHVLVEKPLALSLNDANRMVAAAEAHPQSKVTVGFNLRHHRLIARAKQLLARGAIGEIQLVRTAWMSGLRVRTQMPAWRNRRQTGGGVLCEVAVHHIDLLRYLTGADIEEVYAQSRHGEGDDESATIDMRCTNGVLASCAFSEHTSDANEIELIGREGRLAFSIYRFDSLAMTFPGRSVGRAGSALASLKALPECWPILRRGGDFLETYRREWLAFIDVIRRDRPVAATVADGLAALRVVLAATASASAGRPVAVSDAPPVPATVDRPAEAPRPISVDVPAGPGLSAIIATRGSFDVIRRTVRHLRAQSVANSIELLIVCTDAQTLSLPAHEVGGFHSHRVVEVEAMRSIARANATGVRAASAPVVVLCEDHSFPDSRWAEALLIAHRGPYAAVGPVVRNANPSGAISRADCLMGYGPWMEPKRPCEPEHLPGHNCSYKRQILLDYGDRLDEMLEAETVLHWDLRARGHRIYLDPSARIAHTNFAQFGVWTKVQFHAGRVFGATRAVSWPIWKRLVYACGSPLIPLVRLKRLLKNAAHVNSSDYAFLRDTPALLWGLAMDGLGQMAGYVAGVGAARERSTEYEFERVRYVTDQDRRNLEAADAALDAEHSPREGNAQPL